MIILKDEVVCYFHVNCQSYAITLFQEVITIKSHSNVKADDHCPISFFALYYFYFIGINLLSKLHH